MRNEKCVNPSYHALCANGDATEWGDWFCWQCRVSPQNPRTMRQDFRSGCVQSLRDTSYIPFVSVRSRPSRPAEAQQIDASNVSDLVRPATTIFEPTTSATVTGAATIVANDDVAAACGQSFQRALMESKPDRTVASPDLNDRPVAPPTHLNTPPTFPEFSKPQQRDIREADSLFHLYTTLLT